MKGEGTSDGGLCRRRWGANEPATRAVSLRASLRLAYAPVDRGQVVRSIVEDRIREPYRTTG
jgi:hypothetical protein